MKLSRLELKGMGYELLLFINILNWENLKY